MLPDPDHITKRSVAVPAREHAGQARFIALINARAGEVLQNGAATFSSIITESFLKAGVHCDLRFVPPQELPRAIKAALDDKPDAILIAGGDGTVNRLLPKMAAVDIPIGLLPLGTLNLLARDIGLEGQLVDIVPVLARMSVQRVDLGDVNGNLFHTNAGLGFFARMAREREEARHRLPFSKSLGFVFAAFRSLWLHNPIRIETDVNGVKETFSADALLVTNNHFQGSEWRRDRLNTGLLEVHMLHASSIWGRMHAALAVYRGTWRTLPHLRSVTASAITVTRRGKSRSKIALDGEIYTVQNPIRFRSKPAAVELITGREETGPA